MEEIEEKDEKCMMSGSNGSNDPKHSNLLLKI